MLTDIQIETAALVYESDCLRQDISYADVDFIAGARWAAACLDAEIMRLRSENERLAAAVARLTDHIEELQKTFEK